MEKETSRLTGIILEENVFVNFGEHEGKSVLEISDTLPEYYEYLIQKKNQGTCTIRRANDKSFQLHMSL